MARTGLTKEQHQVLLKDLDNVRVSTRKQGGKTLSYLESWDVKRYLIRVFGFGGFSADVIDNVFRYETCTKKKVKEKDENGETVEVERETWEIAYQATVRLTIHSLGCTYTESAVGSAYGSRAEAHDNAIKNAASDALKRAAIFLGTQFGLSLYSNGKTGDIVVRTLVGPESSDDPEELSLERVQYWRDAFQECADRKALSAVWLKVLDENIEKIPYNASGRTLLDDVNERLAEFNES